MTFFKINKNTALPPQPCKTCLQFANSLNLKELAYLEHFGRPLQPFRRERRDSYGYKGQTTQPFIIFAFAIPIFTRAVARLEPVENREPDRLAARRGPTHVSPCWYTKCTLELQWPRRSITGAIHDALSDLQCLCSFVVAFPVKLKNHGMVSNEPENSV